MKFHYFLLKPSLTNILNSGCRQEVESICLHVGQLQRCEDVVVEKQDGVLAHNLESAVTDLYFVERIL